MEHPITVTEGRSIALRQILRQSLSPEIEHDIRRVISHLNGRLRLTLRLRQEPILFEENDEPRLKFQGIAGTLVLRGREIDISPKHADNDVGDWRQGLVLMLSRSSRRGVRYSRSRRLQLAHRTFLDQFAYSFALALETATGGPPIRQYRPFRQETKFLQGRLVISQQLRKSMTRPDLLICDSDSLDTVNPQNHLLLWVGDQLMARTADAQVKRILSVQLDKLPSMPRISLPPSRLGSVVPRQYAHYDGALQLATAFVRGQSTFPGLANVDGAGFLVGTERLFESFVEKTLGLVCSTRAADSWSVRAQTSEVFAEGIGHTRNFFSKPDNIVDIDSVPRLVVDAKYKRFADSDDFSLGSKPTNGDVYQMAAACIAHNSPRALLLYPRLSNSTEEPPTWRVRWWGVRGTNGTPIYVGAACVDLSMLSAPDKLLLFDERVEALIQQAATQPIPVNANASQVK
ncbi:McrC family protein [Arthrobacter sp. StoSoilB22]|uniref:McrC family protein n=1 Tax=Arthrobacter sp. StoSoilB22 TaxID=2830996 RepID=UPI001CC484D1